MPKVTGSIVFGEDIVPFVGATVYARLEDVSLTDTSARTVAESVMLNIEAGGQAPNEIAFTIDAPCLNPGARYVVRVHVDLDADGQIGVGDYVSTASQTVSAGGSNAKLLIPVKRVS